MSRGDRANKITRMLDIYSRLMDGSEVSKAKLAAHYGVHERSIQRDIDDLRSFFADGAVSGGPTGEIVYNRSARGYRLKRIYEYKLDCCETMAVGKILLDSRAFPEDQMHAILGKLIACCVSAPDREVIGRMLDNEIYHYIPVHHSYPFSEHLWCLARAIYESCMVEVCYQKVNQIKVRRRLMPAAIMFSEYYFYLIAFIEDKELQRRFAQEDPNPVVYRVDRIEELRVLNESFHIPYSDRFEEGEFRKRVQFMYNGKLRRIRFTYSGPDIHAVLDRLPTAQIISEKDGVYTVAAEVFGDGIDMWIRSQGDYIKVL